MQFQVLIGGKSETASTSSKKFVSAYVTDTRLMGVIGLFAHWELPDNSINREFYQLFYIDTAEFGLESCDCFWGDPDDEEFLEDVRYAQARIFGGLGAKRIHITEKELRFLLQKYAAYNRDHGIELPDDFEYMEFLMEPIVELTQTEAYVLMCKNCTSIHTPYQTIHYFLMRCFAKDFEAAKFLTKHYVRTDIFPNMRYGTLLQNTITEADSPDSGTNSNYYATDNDRSFGTFQTRKSYLCESLVEADDCHYIVVTQVTLDRLDIVKYERVSQFRITPEEASMILAHSEYVTVFDFIGDGEEFTEDATPLTRNAMVTSHETGRLFMIFHPHNEHVAQPVFRLSDDVLGIYYVLDNGQIILCSYSAKGIRLLENDFLQSQFGPVSVPISRYQFQSPVLGEFTVSEYEDFEDFVDLITGREAQTDEHILHLEPKNDEDE